MKKTAKVSLFGFIFTAMTLMLYIPTARAFKRYTDMVLVPGGEFWMGSTPEEVRIFKKKYGNRDMYRNYPFEKELPKRKVYLKSFLIDKNEVTNLEYYRFVLATGHRRPKNWYGGRPKRLQLNRPVLYVSQKDAEAYAKWAGKRLPTAAEWEKAARGTDGRIFPWGNRFDPYKAALAESDLRLIMQGLCNVNSAQGVNTAPGDVSPYGVHDMAGNVREWTATLSPEDPSLAMVKGASWVDLSINARAAHRAFIPRDSRSHLVGFRCVVDTE